MTLAMVKVEAQFSIIYVLLIPGEYTCTAINSLGECSTSALLLGPDRYQAWLAEQGKGPAAAHSPRMAQLESPIPKRPDSFYRPVAEKILDVTSEAPLSDYDDPDKVSIYSHGEKLFHLLLYH